MNISRAFQTRAAAAVTVLALGCFASSAHAQATPGTPTADPTAPAAGAPPAAPAAASSTPESRATTEPPAAGPHRTIWPWLIIGTGAALIVTATVLEVHAVAEDERHDQDEEKLFSIPTTDTAARKPLEDSADSHAKSAKSTRTTALVVGSIGFIAVAGAVLLWFYEGSSGGSATAEPAPATKAKSTLLPSFAPGYAGASFGTAF